MIYDEENGLFISQKNMNDMLSGKGSKVVSTIKRNVPFQVYKGIMNDFHKTVIYEIMPALQLDLDWLRKTVGFNGNYYANISSHGVDAMMYDPITKQKATLELKLFNTLKSDTVTRYYDGANYWNVDKKTWKFRPSNGSMLSADFALCIMADAETDTVIDAVITPNADMLPLLPMTTKFKSIHYSHVRFHNHMRGNESPAVKLQTFVSNLISDGVIYRNSPRGTFFSKFSPQGLTKTYDGVKAWFDLNYPEIIDQYYPA